MNPTTRQKFSPWIAAAFCAFLSLITVVGNIVLSFVVGPNGGDSMIGFLCFIPMCFYFVGMVIYQMQGEIGQLKRQIANLQQQSQEQQPG